MLFTVDPANGAIPVLVFFRIIDHLTLLEPSCATIDLQRPLSQARAWYNLYAYVRCEQGMEEDGVRPTEKFYMALLRATGEGNRTDKTIHILQEMREAGLTPGVRSYNCAVGACGKVSVSSPRRSILRHWTTYSCWCRALICRTERCSIRRAGVGRGVLSSQRSQRCCHLLRLQRTGARIPFHAFVAKRDGGILAPPSGAAILMPYFLII